MEANLAVLVRLVMLGEVDIDRFCATTLSVLDSGSGGLAGSDLFALGSIFHVVVELNVNVKLNGDIDVRDGETRLSLVAAEGSRLLLVDLVLDALRSKGTTCEVIPLAKGV